MMVKIYDYRLSQALVSRIIAMREQDGLTDYEIKSQTGLPLHVIQKTIDPSYTVCNDDKQPIGRVIHVDNLALGEEEYARYVELRQYKAIHGATAVPPCVRDATDVRVIENTLGRAAKQELIRSGDIILPGKKKKHAKKRLMD